MNSMWDETELVIESVPNSGLEGVGSYLSGETRLLPLKFAHWGELGSEEEEASVGQWLSGIGQGAATGAATGMAAGPWGALIGGLVGGGLGAAQTAMAPKQTAAPAPPAQRRAPATPPQAAQPPRPPTPRPASRPVTAQAKAPAKVSGSGAAASGTALTAQLLDQLATLVPVVAALAVQVGQLTQNAQAGTEAYEEQSGSAPPESDQERAGEADGYGESGEDAFEEGSWPENPGGEWLSSGDRADTSADA